MLTVGDRVMIAFPPGEQTVFDSLKEFEGTVTVIKEDRYYKKTRSTAFHAYTLEGCASKHGIDYEFASDWLIPLNEEEKV